MTKKRITTEETTWEYPNWFPPKDKKGIRQPGKLTAIAFGEWLRTFDALTRENGYWVLESQISTEELYEAFLAQQPKP